MAKSAQGVTYRCKNGPDHDGPCYQYFTKVTNFENKTGQFVVVVGCGIVSTTGGQTNDNFVITVANTALTIDSVYITSIAYGVPADQMAYMLYMPRRMLVPQTYIVQTALGSQLGLALIQCATLEDALAIL